MTRDLGLNQAVSFWGSRALLIVCCLAGGALLGMTRLRLLLGAAAAGLLVLWLAVAYTPLVRVLGADLQRRDPPAAADAVIVLGSDIQLDGDLSSSAQSRLLRGLELLRQGLAPRLVITNFGSEVPHELAVRRVLRDLRLEPELLVVGPAYNTHEESLAVAKLLLGRGIHRALLVTSPFHTRRAAAVFEQAGLEIIAVPSVETAYDVESMREPDDRLRAFGPILHERVGLLVYRWRGWLR